MPEDKTQRRPIIDPLLLALKSRRVLVALVALLVGGAVTLLPELHTVRGELLVLVLTLALAVIGGYSLEDAATAARGVPIPPDTDLHSLLKETLSAVIDEVVQPLDTRPPLE